MPRMGKTSLNLLLVGGLGFLLFLLTACPRKGRRAVAVTPLPSTAAALLDELAADQLSYTTLALQYKATFIGERRQNFTLRVHILKDSLLWLSAGLLGLEGARALVRPDSAFLMQRLEKTLYYAALDTLRQLFPAYTLSDLANLLLGRWPIGLSHLPWTWDIRSATLSAPYQQTYLRATLTPNRPLRLLQWEVILPTGPTLSLAYEWRDQPIPTQITLILPSEEKILLQLSDFDPHAPDLSFAFRVPPDYKRLPLLVK